MTNDEQLTHDLIIQSLNFLYEKANLKSSALELLNDDITLEQYTKFSTYMLSVSLGKIQVTSLRDVSIEYAKITSRFTEEIDWNNMDELVLGILQGYKNEGKFLSVINKLEA